MGRVGVYLLASGALSGSTTVQLVRLDRPILGTICVHGNSTALAELVNASNLPPAVKATLLSLLQG